MAHRLGILVGLLLFCGIVCGQVVETSSVETKTFSGEVQDTRPSKDVEKYLGWAVTSGLWIPQGHSRLFLGIHPSLGLMVDGWYGNFVFDAVLEFRFLNAAHEYTVLYQGVPETTKGYFGGLIGAQFGYAFLNSENTSAYAFGGLGLDGFDAIDQDTQHEDAVSINVLNKNLGLGVRRSFKNIGFFGVEILYNFIHYHNPGGTPLDGNSVSLRFLFGRLRSTD